MKKCIHVGRVAALAFGLFCSMTTGFATVLSVCDEPSLRAAIAAGGWVSVTCNGTVTLSNTIPITNTVSLDASGVSFAISGGNAVRIFYVAPGAGLTATNLTLANGNVFSGTAGLDAGGAAIYNDGGNISLAGCTIVSNRVATLIPNPGPWQFTFARGGAVFNSGGTVLLQNCLVALNSATAGGAPNYMAGSLASGLGGAFYNTNGSLTLTGCQVISNSSSATTGWSGVTHGDGVTKGGGIFQASGALTISNTAFESNLALGGAGSGDTSGSPAYGGALAAEAGTVLIEHSRFLANSATGGAGGNNNGRPGFGYGGAIYAAATIDVAASVFSGNQAAGGRVSGTPIPAEGDGGAVFNISNAVFVGCLISSNSAQGGRGDGGIAYGKGGNAYGGGIYNASQLAMTNCTVAFNLSVGGITARDQYSFFPALGPIYPSGAAGGGGIFVTTNATGIAMNSTLASNTCVSPFASDYTNSISSGAQIGNTNGTVKLHNCIVASSGSNVNAYGSITDDGFNIGSDASASFSAGGSLNNTDPRLGPLASYGGPTPCMALRYNSPAINTGDSSGAPFTDQRGAVRPNGAGVDIGAYEFYSNQIDVPALGIAPATNSAVLSFQGYPSGLYHLLTSSNLVSWTDAGTFGPYSGMTNVSQMVSSPGVKTAFYRLLLP